MEEIIMNETNLLEQKIREQNPEMTDKQIEQIAKLKQQENRAKEKIKKIKSQVSAQKRKERTKLLCDLGGLVLKAGLQDMDRETLLGALLSMQQWAKESPNSPKIQGWKREGQKAMEKK